MAWSTAERVLIRKYMGFPALFHQIEPRLENAITAVQSQADGGALADGTTESDMRLTLQKIANIDTLIASNYAVVMVEQAGGNEITTKLDAAKSIFVLKQQGRIEIGRLAITLGCKIPRDYYSSSPQNMEENFFFI